MKITETAREANLARDRFWLWGHETGSHNTEWDLPGASRISPVEAACYMGIPNLIMVRYQPAPLPPDAQYLVPFRTLRRVVWSVIGAGAMHGDDDVDRALDTAQRLPGMCGVMMDDFFRRDRADAGTLSTAQLHALRQRLAHAARPLPLWVVLYDHQLDLPVGEHLALCDKVTFWTWHVEDLARLEDNFSAFERLVPEGARRVLGCYMWDYGRKRPMPLDVMERQCERGLCWLREQRISGMIFLASCICDLDLPAVEWTRRWIARVGDLSL